MNRKFRTGTLAGVFVLLMFLLACGQISPGTTVPEAPALISTHTPTPTPGIILLGNPGGDPYSHGEIEMRTKDFLSGGEDCVSFFSFTINRDTDPPTIKGEGSRYCHFQGSGACAMHAVMEYAVITVEGEIVYAEGSAGILHVVLTFNGSMKNYFTDCPETNPFTESNPWIWNDSGPLALDFNYVDGDTVTVSRGNPVPSNSNSSGEISHTFILHLK